MLKEFLWPNCEQVLLWRKKSIAAVCKVLLPKSEECCCCLQYSTVGVTIAKMQVVEKRGEDGKERETYV